MTTEAIRGTATNIRVDLRYALHTALDDALLASEKRVEIPHEETADGGKLLDPDEGLAWQNVPVVTRADLNRILHDVFYAPLPAPDERTAEVRTNSTVLVWASCPRCGIPAAIRLHVSPTLTIDDTGSSLKLKASAKAAYHVCGQELLPLEGTNGKVEPAEDEAPEVVPIAEGQVAAFDAAGGDAVEPAPEPGPESTEYAWGDGAREPAPEPGPESTEYAWGDGAREAFAAGLAVEPSPGAVLDALLIVDGAYDGPRPTRQGIEEWPIETRREVFAWATEVAHKMTEQNDGTAVELPPAPAVLRKPDEPKSRRRSTKG